MLAPLKKVLMTDTMPSLNTIREEFKSFRHDPVNNLFLKRMRNGSKIFVTFPSHQIHSFQHLRTIMYIVATSFKSKPNVDRLGNI